MNFEDAWITSIATLDIPEPSASKRKPWNFRLVIQGKPLHIRQKFQNFPFTVKTSRKVYEIHRRVKICSRKFTN